MRKLSALAVVSLLALTGCAAPVGEAAPATVTVTASPEAQEAAPETAETPIPGALRDLTTTEFDSNIKSMQTNLSYIGIGSKDFPKPKLVDEIKKVCAQHFDYEGLPISGASDADNGRFIQVANNMFC